MIFLSYLQCTHLKCRISGDFNVDLFIENTFKYNFVSINISYLLNIHLYEKVW